MASVAGPVEGRAEESPEGPAAEGRAEESEEVFLGILVGILIRVARSSSFVADTTT